MRWWQLHREAQNTESDQLGRHRLMIHYFSDCMDRHGSHCGRQRNRPKSLFFFSTSAHSRLSSHLPAHKVRWFFSPGRSYREGEKERRRLLRSGQLWKGNGQRAGKSREERTKAERKRGKGYMYEGEILFCEQQAMLLQTPYSA